MYVSTYSAFYCRPILNTILKYEQSLEKPNIKFHKNSLANIDLFHVYGQTDRAILTGYQQAR
jgi:hypothetical protein